MLLSISKNEEKRMIPKIADFGLSCKSMFSATLRSHEVLFFILNFSFFSFNIKLSRIRFLNHFSQGPKSHLDSSRNPDGKSVFRESRCL